MKFDLKDCLIVIACKEESEGLFEKLTSNIIFTGVGKINATYHLTKRIQQNKPKYVVNLGSVGSKKFKKGELVYCNKFLQRDMDVRIFGYDNYVTPSDVLTNSSKTQAIIEHRELITDLPNAICGTGDGFVTNGEVDKVMDVYDMEGYALARVCKLEGIDFVSIKYITDGLDADGGKDWKNNVKSSAEIMYDYFVK
ncbi:MAG: hypothetical protein LBT02_03585 [Rickettsiales bacterium]|jgi:adenosylhomocysteine nucleosidase|nr:hypothetical protein [Rickettsiales bacterium]